jgi:hypothetical protein
VQFLGLIDKCKFLKKSQTIVLKILKKQITVQKTASSFMKATGSSRGLKELEMAVLRF